MFPYFHGTSSEFGRRFHPHSRIYTLVALFLLSGLLYLTTALTQPKLIALAQTSLTSPISTSRSLRSTTPSSVYKNMRVVGFLPSWNLNRHTIVYPEYLDQIIYFGIGINAQGQLMRRDEQGNELIEMQNLHSPELTIIRQRAKQTHTKFLVTIKSFDNATIDAIISNPTSSQRAISQIAKLIGDEALDGVDLNFEYFTATDFPTMKYLNTFLTSLRTQLKKQKPDLILSFDVNASVVYSDSAYDMVKIGEQMDQIILMGYDYTRADSSQSGPVAPLYADGSEPSIDRSVRSLLGRVPEEKIILALPLYGYEWQTTSTAFKSPSVPSTGALATYKRVRNLLQEREVELSYDEYSRSPRIVYTQNGTINQIYFEDEASLEEKFEYATSKELGGVALWALGYEGSYIEPWILIKNTLRVR